MALSLAAAVLVLGLVAALGPPRRQHSPPAPLRQAMVISMYSQSAQQQPQLQPLGDLGTVKPVNGSAGSLDSLLQQTERGEGAPLRPNITNPVAQYLYDRVRVSCCSALGHVLVAEAACLRR